MLSRWGRAGAGPRGRRRRPPAAPLGGGRLALAPRGHVLRRVEARRAPGRRRRCGPRRGRSRPAWPRRARPGVHTACLHVVCEAGACLSDDDMFNTLVFHIVQRGCWAGAVLGGGDGRPDGVLRRARAAEAAPTGLRQATTPLPDPHARHAPARMLLTCEKAPGPASSMARCAPCAASAAPCLYAPSAASNAFAWQPAGLPRTLTRQTLRLRRSPGRTVRARRSAVGQRRGSVRAARARLAAHGGAPRRRAPHAVRPAAPAQQRHRLGRWDAARRAGDRALIMTPAGPGAVVHGTLPAVPLACTACMPRIPRKFEQ